MIQIIITNWVEILACATSVVATASIIAKATGNETANKYVFRAQQVVDFFAMSTGKTKLKDKNLSV